VRVRRSAALEGVYREVIVDLQSTRDAWQRLRDDPELSVETRAYFGGKVAAMNTAIVSMRKIGDMPTSDEELRLRRLADELLDAQGNVHVYTVKIVLVTEAGDPPDLDGVENMIASQMSGELDDPVECGGTGLFCGGVVVIE